MDGENGMKRIAEEVRDCRKCGLWKTRNEAVPGEGPADARIMLIGEGPGANEDREGRPFVGRAGKVLEELLETAGLERDSVYIANIIKCRPPQNRNPMAEEIRACTPYLDRQISVIRPGTICPMGNFASAYVLEKFGFKPEGIGKIHGKTYRVKNLIMDGKIIPLYHPASAVYNPEMKAVLMADFRNVNNPKGQ